MRTATHEKALRAMLAELRGHTVERAAIHMDHEPDKMDQSRLDEDVDLLTDRLDYEAHLMHDVELALEKVEQGGYGRCESCGQMMSEARLEALPWARHCVRCQTVKERRAANGAVAAMT